LVDVAWPDSMTGVSVHANGILGCAALRSEPA